MDTVRAYIDGGSSDAEASIELGASEHHADLLAELTLTAKGAPIAVLLHRSQLLLLAEQAIALARTMHG